MAPTNIRVERNIERAFDLVREVADHPDRFPDQFVAIPLDPETLARLFSKERLRLLRVLRDAGPFESIGALADALERDQTRVSRDLVELVHAGLARIERRGKTKIVKASDRAIVLA
jgi:predicted transcriptional regulator